MGPAEMRRLAAELQSALTAAWPRLRALAERPGFGELRSGILSALSRRALARTIKAVFGPQARSTLLILDALRDCDLLYSMSSLHWLLLQLSDAAAVHDCSHGCVQCGSDLMVTRSLELTRCPGERPGGALAS